jgi:hypothetical protein
MKIRVVLVLNLMFYILGAYHFSTFNIFDFEEVESIIMNYSDADTSLYFLLTCELIILIFSYLISKHFFNEK